MRFGHEHQTRESKHCGKCGKPRPDGERGPAHFELPPIGWEYALVASGPTPIYRWECPDCLAFVRRITTDTCPPGAHEWKTIVIPSTPDQPPGERVCYCDVCGVERVREDQ